MGYSFSSSHIFRSGKTLTEEGLLFLVIIFNIQNKNTYQLVRVRFMGTSEAVGFYSVESTPLVVPIAIGRNTVYWYFETTHFQR